MPWSLAKLHLQNQACRVTLGYILLTVLFMNCRRTNSVPTTTVAVDKANVDTALSKYLDFVLKFGEEKLSKLEADAKELEENRKSDKDEK